MEGLRLSLGSYYKQFSSPEQQSTPIVSAPFVDYSGLGVVISVCKPVYYDHKLQGVAAIDLRLADLFSSVTYYYSGEYSYAFIIDNSGRTFVPVISTGFRPIYIAVISAVGAVVVVAILILAGIFCCRTTASTRERKGNEYDNAPRASPAPSNEPSPDSFYEELN
ncbi:hypothetical protein LSAT2_007519 [Lamellibrachia satsuma]|nr:hypothetical protein LSAT2_007519 [Lamellibrachia satsuma]